MLSFCNRWRQEEADAVIMVIRRFRTNDFDFECSSRGGTPRSSNGFNVSRVDEYSRASKL